MKKIGKIKLNELNKREMEKKQINILRGGYDCSSGTNCWCPTVPAGGISTSQNNSDGWYQFDKEG